MKDSTTHGCLSTHHTMLYSPASAPVQKAGETEWAELVGYVEQYILTQEHMLGAFHT